ncbi:MAG: hypothetical protein AB7W37_05480 [Syntrophobacteraceae bacterium]
MKGKGPDEVAFSGRITAAFTHEVKNVLAIIKEASGLMEDLLLMSKAAPFPHKERFERAIGTIQAQVQRGVELSTRLNRFAHSLDEPLASVDLKEIVDQFALLAKRFATLREMTLRSDAASVDGTFNILTSPVRFQMALLAAVESCWAAMPPGGAVALLPERREEGAAVMVSCEGDLGERDSFVEKVGSSKTWEALLEVQRVLGGTVEWVNGAYALRLVFPSGEEGARNK